MMEISNGTDVGEDKEKMKVKRESLLEGQKQ